MARLDVYRLDGDDAPGYVLDVQADLLNDLQTRVVVPLIPVNSGFRPIAEINPVFELAGAPHILMAQSIGSVPARALRRPAMSLAAHHDTVTRALDVLLLGF
jgi:toxin CcdB